MDEGKSNPNTGVVVHSKQGIVPKPKGDYLQAGVENDGNKIEKIADAPSVHNRESSHPHGGTVDSLKKPATFGHSYPGRKAPAASAVTTAECKADGYVKGVRDKQLGSNGLRGN